MRILDNDTDTIATMAGGTKRPEEPGSVASDRWVGLFERVGGNQPIQVDVRIKRSAVRM